MIVVGDCGFGTRTVASSVQHEERRGSPSELEIRHVLRVFRGGRNRWVHGNVVMLERIRCGWKGVRFVTTRPVIGDFVIVQGVKPGQGFEAGEGPGRRGVDAAVFGAVVGGR